MAREKVTRRQKDISRLLREKKQIHRDKVQKTGKGRPHKPGMHGGAE